jgi:hypothetical protein
MKKIHVVKLTFTKEESGKINRRSKSLNLRPSQYVLALLRNDLQI